MKAFISYAHDNEQHKEIVLNYANDLRDPGGIDCSIDRYIEDEQLPDGLINWMRDQIHTSDWVLVVCSEKYYLRYNRVPGEAGKGHGAKIESTLILNELYNGEMKNHKFIPVILKPADKKYILDILSDQTYYDLSDDASKENLYRKLTNQPRNKKPPVSKTFISLDSNKVHASSAADKKVGTLISTENLLQIEPLLEMKPGTKIVNAFLELPLYRRFEIAQEMNLLEQGENLDSPNLDKLSAQFLERAYKLNRLAELWDLLFKDEKHVNPFNK